MIKFGIRQSFDRIEQIEDRYANLSVSVEVALPYYWDRYEPVNDAEDICNTYGRRGLHFLKPVWEDHQKGKGS